MSLRAKLILGDWMDWTSTRLILSEPCHLLEKKEKEISQKPMCT